MSSPGVMSQIEQAVEEVQQITPAEPAQPCLTHANIMARLTERLEYLERRNGEVVDAVKRELADYASMRGTAEEGRLNDIYGLIIKLGTKIDRFGRQFNALPCQAGKVTKKKARR